MKISTRIPTIYLILKKKFGVQWDKGIIITYGDTIYCKYKISPDLEVHEATHIKQQADYGVKEWWERYIVDAPFRLSQELEAYKTQAEWIRKHSNNQKFLLEKIWTDISSSIYGNMITYEEAKKLI